MAAVKNLPPCPRLSRTPPARHRAVLAHAQRPATNPKNPSSSDLSRGSVPQTVPWIEALFAEPNPGPIKAMLALARVIHNELRAPMAAASHEPVTRMSQLRQHPQLRLQGPLERHPQHGIAVGAK